MSADRDLVLTRLPNRGVYLEVAPDEKLVSTDAYVKAWEPSEEPS